MEDVFSSFERLKFANPLGQPLFFAFLGNLCFAVKSKSMGTLL